MAAVGKRSRWPRRLVGGLVGSLLLPPAAAVAQAVPTARFLRSGVHVGELVDYELTFRHASGLEVIFPDSTANFAPFEYVSKVFQPTRTRQGQSLDRAVYRVRTFALDSTQALSVPVTILSGHDTLTVALAPARIRLLRTVAAAAHNEPLATALHQNTVLQDVPAEFNYPYWLAGLGGVVLLIAGLGLGFGNRLRRRYQRYKLRKNHAYFLAQYARHIERFTLSRSLANMERAITLWKNYLTGLEDNSINSLTTKEIAALYEENPDVRTALRIADRVIYANQFTEDEEETDLAFELLRNFAEQRYQLLTAPLSPDS